MMSLAEAASLVSCVAVRCPFFMCLSRRTSSLGSINGVLPFFIRLMVRWFASTAMTLNPASAKRQAWDRPIRPHPITLSVYFSRFSGVLMSSFLSVIISGIFFHIVSILYIVFTYLTGLYKDLQNQLLLNLFIIS